MAEETPTPAEAGEAGLETKDPVEADTTTADAGSEKPIQDNDEDDDEDEISLMAEFMLFLKEEKKWWLAPIVIVLVLLSSLFIFASGSGVAPFIYTLF